MTRKRRRCLVRHRSRNLFTVVLIALISLTCGTATLAGQNRSTSPPAKWTPPKTAGGDPDLQGTWTSTTTTPLERPPQFGNRLLLTDQEFAESQRQLERQLAADNQETSPNARVGTGPPDHWTERASKPLGRRRWLCYRKTGACPCRHGPRRQETTTLRTAPMPLST